MTVEEAQHTLQADSVAQHVLRLPLIARLAYTWRDGSPRVVPCGFTGRAKRSSWVRHRKHPR
jgi:hypothetical protein